MTSSIHKPSTHVAIAFLVIAAIFFLFGRSSAQSETPVRNGTVTQYLSNGTHSATLKIQPEAGTIEVHLINEPNIAPPSVEIAFFDGSSKPLVLSLHSIQLEGPRSAVYSGEYSPSLAPRLGATTGSYVGIELRIPFSIGDPSVLRPVGSLYPVGSMWNVSPFSPQ